ncbi:Uncharacterized protein At1g32220, chloroplastic [Linum perenne]
MASSSFQAFTAAISPSPRRTKLSKLPLSSPPSLPIAPYRRLSLNCRRNRVQVKCSYAGTSVRDGSDSIDVVANVKSEKIVVLGGSGFVGSAICKAAVEKGIEVVSLSRSGRPSLNAPWVDQVTWVPGKSRIFSPDFDSSIIIPINPSYHDESNYANFSFKSLRSSEILQEMFSTRTGMKCFQEPLLSFRLWEGSATRNRCRGSTEKPTL